MPRKCLTLTSRSIWSLTGYIVLLFSCAPVLRLKKNRHHSSSLTPGKAGPWLSKSWNIPWKTGSQHTYRWAPKGKDIESDCKDWFKFCADCARTGLHDRWKRHLQSKEKGFWWHCWGLFQGDSGGPLWVREEEGGTLPIAYLVCKRIPG